VVAPFQPIPPHCPQCAAPVPEPPLVEVGEVELVEVELVVPVETSLMSCISLGPICPAMN
jgi:hypothetical protein